VRGHPPILLEVLAVGAEPGDHLPAVEGEGVRPRPRTGAERHQPAGPVAVATPDERVGLLGR
jgi:hypothetical protein